MDKVPSLDERTCFHGQPVFLHTKRAQTGTKNILWESVFSEVVHPGGIAYAPVVGTYLMSATRTAWSRKLQVAQIINITASRSERTHYLA